jgi:hypothetical protein
VKRNSFTSATCSRWFLARGFFYHEDGGNKFLRNIVSHKNYTAPHPPKKCILLSGLTETGNMMEHQKPVEVSDAEMQVRLSSVI